MTVEPRVACYDPSAEFATAMTPHPESVPPDVCGIVEGDFFALIDVAPCYNLPFTTYDAIWFAGMVYIPPG